MEVQQLIQEEFALARRSNMKVSDILDAASLLNFVNGIFEN